MNIKKLTFYFLLLASCGARELALAFESGSKLPHSKETPYSITNITDGRYLPQGAKYLKTIKNSGISAPIM